MTVARLRQIAQMVRYIGKPLILLAIYDQLVVLAYKLLHWNWLSLPHIPLALYGSAIGIILSFRNLSCYGRWWEARTLWGAIVNNSRSWARQVVSMRPINRADSAELATMQRRMVYHQIAYVHALRQHLRKLSPWPDLAPLLSDLELSELQIEKNVPLALQRRMTDMLQYCRDRGWTEGWQWLAMDRSLCDLANAQGGAERIKNTPMPKQYDFFPQLFVHIYCVLLPLALVGPMGWYTPLGSTLVGFIFLALDKIGRDLEDPFENTSHDVPLNSITRTIDINLRQLLGETNLPEDLPAMNEYLVESTDFPEAIFRRG
jgi:ion channel-forming bestrophin family protein